MEVFNNEILIESQTNIIYKIDTAKKIQTIILCEDE